MKSPKEMSEDEFNDVSFLNPEKLKETKEKMDSGELTCNIQDPDNCESCSG